MGFSMSWAAVKGGTPQAVFDALQLRGTGEREDVPDSDITGTELPGGWYMVASNRDGLELTTDAVLANLSGVGEVVMCFIEEHVMFSSAACWRNGQRVWSIEHDAGSKKGVYDLVVEGEPPPSFAAVRDRLFAEQSAAGGAKAEVDHIFDIPVELAYSLAGYRPDLIIESIRKDGLEVLVSTKPPEPLSWWKKWIKSMAVLP